MKVLDNFTPRLVWSFREDIVSTWFYLPLAIHVSVGCRWGIKLILSQPWKYIAIIGIFNFKSQ